MTGAYLRVKRDGKWKAIEVEHLTNQERDLLFSKRDAYELVRWLNMTCKKLCEVESLLDELVEDGVIINK